MKRYCLLLDLKDDEKLIAQYEEWHGKVWPEIIASIRNAGILNMEIFRHQNRLSMLMEVDDSFDFERKASMDAANPKVQEWETLMNAFQQQIPGAKPGEKWMLAERIFALENF